MAHIGRFYPLTFRRDLASNIENNHDAYSRAYYVTADNLSGLVGPFLNGQTLYCRDTGTLAGAFARWISPVTRINGRDITAVLKITGVIVAGEIVSELTLFDQIRGEMVKSQLRGTGTHKYQRLFGRVSPGADYDPAIIQIDGPASSFTLQSLSWAQYNAL